MKKIKRILVAIVTGIIVLANTTTPIIYANELNNIAQEQQKIEQATAEVDQKLSRPIDMSDEELNALIKEKKALYPNLTEQEMQEIAYKVLSPYSSRASVWDGQGVTLNEFAWAFDVIVGGLISGYATIGKYAAKQGVAAARAMLSRAARAAAQRVGVLSSMVSGLLGAAFSVINIYYNVGYALAQFIDARDYHPNNGRINAWA